MIRRLALSIVLASFALAPAGAAQAPKSPAAPATTVILVRHAEAIPNAGSDPGLSEAGLARAAALRDAVKDAQLKAVITTQYERTVRTGEPLATATKAQLIKVQVEGGPNGLTAHVQGLVQMVHAQYAGGTVVIVGHSNTVPALVKGFTGIDAPDIAHDAYDNMFIVTTNTPGAGKLVRARYGAR